MTADTARLSANSPPDPVSRRLLPHRSWLWVPVILGGMGMIFLPQLISWSPLRNELPRQRLLGFRGAIRVRAASLSWFGPNVLSDVELDAPDGKPFFHARQITENRGVWGALFQRSAPLVTSMSEPTVTVVMRSDGSNVEDALAPVLAAERAVRDRTTHVQGGKLLVVDRTTEREFDWHIETVQVHTDATDGSPNHLEITTLEDGPTKGRLEAVWKWPSARHPVSDPDDAPREFSLKTTNASIERAEALIRRFWPRLTITGQLTGHMQGSFRGAKPVAASSSLDAEWEIQARDIQIRQMGEADGPPVNPGVLETRGRLTQSGSILQLENFALHTGFGQVEGEAGFPLADAGEAAATAPLPATHLHAEVDLVAGARLLSAASLLRSGLELQSGNLTLDLNSEHAAEHARWKGQASSSRIAGRVEGTELAWDKPLKLDFSVLLQQGRYSLEQVSSESDWLTLQGTPTAAGFHLVAGCDLKLLSDRLGEFLNTTKAEIQGQLAATADFSRAPEGQLQIDSSLTLDQFKLQRRVLRIVERRVGDLQPVPTPPPSAPPRESPAVEPPRNRRELAAQRRAERQLRQQERRQDREARKRANQLVEETVSEMQTLWTESALKVTSASRLDWPRRQWTMTSCTWDSDGLHWQAQGALTQIPQICEVDLHGEIQYDIARLLEHGRELLGPFIRMEGQGTDPFSLQGPLRPHPAGEGAAAPVLPAELRGTAGGRWTGGSLFGLPVGPGDLRVTLEQGLLAPRPLEVTLGSGRIRLAPQVILQAHPAQLLLPAGPVLEGVELTDQFCDDWLKYIAPLLAQATRCSGQFSLELDESRLTLLDPANGPLSGRLRIERGEVLPGPMFDEIQSLIGRIIGASGAGTAQELLGLDRPLVQFPEQTIEFELQEGRLYHEAVTCRARGFVIRTQGSVGTDQTLDLVASISLSEDVLSRTRIFSALQGKALEIPIAGTLRRPRPDAKAIGRMAEQLGQSALDQLLNQGLRGFFERPDE